tara:strand:+ start:1564 stop:1707 length:144 start_codon:yes stop_codon:yes gene_type:complete
MEIVLTKEKLSKGVEMLQLYSSSYFTTRHSYHYIVPLLDSEKKKAAQ